MKATELRIGNLIFQSGQITTIENISRSINDLERVNNKRLFDCTPIPITEEWLLKLPKNIKFPEWIKSLHELQNWYYWNNNKKELPINL